ncbi:type II toxin-antitoxin system RelB family antitoxin [Cryobacterium mannosilyticum]|uniref:type II toxin-antitoxin system RelB family antitoxin n=1 Tax=Cryobacterium mannosilyticum TaxID=1259190 RepID=UPI001F545AA6|nr:TraY domain-containing protein [Cryobacterium mannosilyticum]
MAGSPGSRRSSFECGLDAVRALVIRQKAQHPWDFVFLGAEYRRPLQMRDSFGYLERVRYLYLKEVHVAISVRLSPEDEQRLEQLAARTGRSKTFYVREAIHEHLDDLEERYWADRVIREWEETGKKSKPADKLWAELGI